MSYRYEMHLHTSQGSRCGRSTGKEMAQFYKENGYQGIVITDHFVGGNCAADPELPWRDRIEQFCKGYEDALEEGKRIGLDVFFGWEQNYEMDEYLVYGLDKQWLLDHPEVEHWTRKQQLEEVHRHGGCVIQAHPFRDRGYIPKILLGKRFCDGIEVANAGQFPYNDAAALRYAREYDLLMIAGSDNHLANGEKWQSGKLMGIELEKRLENIGELVSIIRNRGPIGLYIPENRFTVQPEDQLKVEVCWLDENENAIPDEREWLHI